jgi:hypothetical protein
LGLCPIGHSNYTIDFFLKQLNSNNINHVIDVRSVPLNRSEDEISVYDEVVKRFGDSTETALKEQVANAQHKITYLTATKI